MKMTPTIKKPQPFERVSIVLSPLFLTNKPTNNANASNPTNSIYSLNSQVKLSPS